MKPNETLKNDGTVKDDIGKRQYEENGSKVWPSKKKKV